jgi:hypothetical protein
MREKRDVLPLADVSIMTKGNFRSGLRYIFTYDKQKKTVNVYARWVLKYFCQRRSFCEIMTESGDVIVGSPSLRLSIDFEPDCSDSHFPYIFLAQNWVPDCGTTRFLDVVYRLLFRGPEPYPSPCERAMGRIYSVGSDQNNYLQRLDNPCQSTTSIRGLKIATLRTCL